MAVTRNIRVNGKRVTASVDDPATPLLYVLRNDAGLHGPRFGCGLGQCGACTVHIDGVPVRSCTAAAFVRPAKMMTSSSLEGLGTPEQSAPAAGGLH